MKFKVLKNKEECSMKITTFDPMIVSPKADELVAFFEKLGNH